MPYSPSQSFRNPWLIQVVDGLGIPDSSFIPGAKPDDPEWNNITGAYVALGIDTTTQLVINSQPFLRLFPGQGSSRSNDGNAPQYVQAGTGVRFEPGQIQRRFTIQMGETRSAILTAIEHVANLSNFGNSAGQSPLLVLDFCWPETQDILACKQINAQPFTVRLGMIDSVDFPGPGAGYPGSDQYRATGGQASFSFRERSLRRAV